MRRSTGTLRSDSVLERFGKFVRRSDFTKERLTSSDLRAIATKLPRLSSLKILARLNLALECSGVSYRPLQEDFISQWVSEKERPFLIHYANSVGIDAIVSPLHVRRALCLVWENANPQRPESLGPSDLTELGRIVLATPDAFDPKIEGCDEGIDRWLKTGLTMIHAGSMSHDPLQRDSPILNFQANCVYSTTEVALKYSKAFSLSPAAHALPHAVLTTFFSGATHEQLQAAGNYLADPYYVFGKFGVKREAGDRFLAENCTSADMFPGRIGGDSVWSASDFSPLFNFPYMWVPGSPDMVLCLDLQFARRKLAGCFFNQLRNLPGSNNFLGDAGRAFEDFATTSLSKACEERRKRGARHYSGRTDSSELDMGYQEGETTALFECKSSVPRVDKVLSVDTRTLKEWIDEKLLAVSPSKASGFGQLVERCRHFRSSPRDYGFRRTTHLQPVLVLKDEFLTSPFVAEYIELKACELFRSAELSVDRPTVVHASDLQFLCSLCFGVSPSDAFLGYAQFRKRNSKWRDFQSWLRYELDPAKNISRHPALSLNYLGVLEDAFDSALASDSAGVSSGVECPACHQDVSIRATQDGSMLYCSQCKKVLHNLSTDENLKTVETHRESMRAKYFSDK